MGVASGCGCKEVYRFPHYLSLLLLYLFFFSAASLLFVNFFILIKSTVKESLKSRLLNSANHAVIATTTTEIKEATSH